MAIKICNKDLFDSDAQILVHQVNCQGVMGSGVAKQVKEHYPQAYRDYVTFCGDAEPSDLMGTVCWSNVSVAPPKWIANCFGQANYGDDGQQYTNYAYLRLSLMSVAGAARYNHCSVALPYKLGCARGGGDWDIVFGIIKSVFGDDVDVEICRCDKG